ncbi:MAG: DDE-type integrase/transposase/recombinase [Clostridia bacterium]|nr:DDE-type integrase/transposase/recombinase [Clostridia bacterium]
MKRLMRNGNIILRALENAGEQVLVIDCLKRTMPVWLAAAELKGYTEISEEELHEATGEYPCDAEMLNPEQRKIAYQRYTMIAGVLPFLADKDVRCQAIRNAAAIHQKSVQTIRTVLWKYLVFQIIGALAPNQRRKEEVLTQDQKNMRWALNKFFYSPKKHSISTAYTLMLKEKYCDNDGHLLPEHPSIHQFRYFYRKHRKEQTYLISRNGIKDYQRNNRPLLGDGVQEFAPAPGTAMLDSTILDIFLVDDGGNLIGRPILTAAVDAYSSMCLGYALTFEGGVYCLRCLMQSILSDKVKWCKQFGISIQRQDWDCTGVIPGTIVTDMGGEYVSETFSQIAELGVTDVNLPAFRPELKGPVEKFFDCIQSLFKPHLKSKGVIEPNFQERGTHDYRMDACLTIRQLEVILLRCIIYYNTQRTLQSFPYDEKMLSENIAPYANTIWNYGRRELRGTNLIPVTQNRLMLTLLPRTKARFSRYGLLANGMRYANDALKER